MFQMDIEILIQDLQVVSILLGQMMKIQDQLVIIQEIILLQDQMCQLLE